MQADLSWNLVPLNDARTLWRSSGIGNPGPIRHCWTNPWAWRCWLGLVGVGVQQYLESRRFACRKSPIRMHFYSAGRGQSFCNDIWIWHRNGEFYKDVLFLYTLHTLSVTALSYNGKPGSSGLWMSPEQAKLSGWHSPSSPWPRAKHLTEFHFIFK